MTSENRIVQTLWIGPRLSALERLCLSSFLAHGHEVHLYVYEPVAGAPPGTVVRDGAEILPASMIFQYRRYASYSAFSNYFRYRLLLERGGWWTDTDVVCLRPFDFPAPHVVAMEVCEGAATAASAVLKAPAGSPLMARAWDVCQTKDPGALDWGEVGPRLVGELVRDLSLEDCLEPPETFCPLGHESWDRVLEAEPAWEPGPATRGLHLWQEMWRRTGQDKDGAYPPGCLFERLKSAYSVP
jgi:hypothetical protein